MGGGDATTAVSVVGRPTGAAAIAIGTYVRVRVRVIVRVKV